jgi:hypothetical protein
MQMFHQELNRIASTSGRSYAELLTLFQEVESGSNINATLGSSINENAWVTLVNLCRGFKRNPHILIQYEVYSSAQMKVQTCLQILHDAARHATKNNPHIDFQLIDPLKCWIGSEEESGRTRFGVAVGEEIYPGISPQARKKFLDACTLIDIFAFAMGNE